MIGAQGFFFGDRCGLDLGQRLQVGGDGVGAFAQLRDDGGDEHGAARRAQSIIRIDDESRGRGERNALQGRENIGNFGVGAIEPAADFELADDEIGESFLDIGDLDLGEADALGGGDEGGVLLVGIAFHGSDFGLERVDAVAAEREGGFHLGEVGGAGPRRFDARILWIFCWFLNGLGRVER